MRRAIGSAAAFLLLLASPGWAAPGAELVKDINPRAGSRPGRITSVDGAMFFRADDGTHGYEPWTSDGTETGTVMVKDINPGRPNSYPYGSVAVDGRVFFSADDGTHGVELWTSDGTEAGTVMVKDIDPGEEGAWPLELVALGDSLYFSATDGTHGAELWTSDGTEAGTVMVKDIAPDWDSDPRSLTDVGGTLFFSAAGGTTSIGSGDIELWRSDGTEAGTVMVENINPDFLSWPTELTDVSGVLFFATFFPAGLWRSDGTADGTVLLTRGITQRHRFSSAPDELTAIGDVVFFRAHDASGYELWRSDGTVEGTHVVKDIHPGEFGSFPEGIGAFGGTLYFAAGDGTHGREIWTSDGTEAGTTMLKDVNPGPADSRSAGWSWYGDGYAFAAVGDTVYFEADDGVHGPEVWMTDGTEMGTLLVADIFPGPRGPAPTYLTAFGDHLFFQASDGERGRELWKYGV